MVIDDEAVQDSSAALVPDHAGLLRAQERWAREAYAKAIERRSIFSTSSGLPLKPLYSPIDLAGFDYQSELGFPGGSPFTRGVQPSMYRGRFWTMRQLAGYGTVLDGRKRLRYLLAQGATGMNIVLDTATINGYDSDHPLASGEVGNGGVAIDTLRDMEDLLEGIPLDRVTASLVTNSQAAVILAMYAAVAAKNGFPLEVISGTLQNDALKEYIAQKSYYFPPRPAMRLVGDIIEFCAQRMPRWNTVSVSGYHIREAGATAVQELAFTLADGLEYVETGVSRGLDVDCFAPRLSFFFSAHSDFFEEIAKYRAARRIWAREMQKRFQPRDPRSLKLRFHTQTSGASLTAQQPENNIVRITLQALAAVLGGTQSLHTNSCDEALAIPSEKAATIALRTQQILAHESRVANTVDPLAGSYFVEALTNQIEQAVYGYFTEIEALGGVLSCIENGFFLREIADASARYQHEVEVNERIIVGVNEYTASGRESLPMLHRVDPVAVEAQLRRLAQVKAERDNVVVSEKLDALASACRGSDKVMPFVLECVHAYATLGEIIGIMRKVFGEYREPAVF